MGIIEAEHTPVGLLRANWKINVIIAEKLVHIDKVLVDSLDTPLLVAGAHKHVKQYHLFVILCVAHIVGNNIDLGER